ncbi:MAG: Sua5/YciO/YrdC/YwlC family protein, partial [Muribaculaceae bacterium]|nr:Sua5/YciO/YrdC/YwlC family protein [Muribaculaceae bacterium]
MNTEQDIANAVEVLKKGGVILYPTDTIWGIGCDATRPEAVRRIYEIKRRSDSKALIVLTDSVHQLERYVADVPEIAYSLIDVAVKPMTIVYDKG